MLAGLLGAVFDVGLNHQALEDAVDGIAGAGAVEHLAGDAALLEILLTGIRMVAVHDDSGIRVVAFRIKVGKAPEILVVVVRMAGAVAVDVTAQDGVGIGVSLAGDIPVAVDERMAVLCGVDGIHHHGEVAAGGILHSHGDVEPARHKPVLLVLDAPGAHRHV